jgi:dTDP-4-dehydrorhamnose reductase
MKTILTGATGLLGEAIWGTLKNEYDIVPVSLSGRNNTVRCDLTQEQEVARLIDEYHPSLVIHTAALTDVDLCEREPKLAHEANTIATRNLTWYSSQIHSAFIYISTDYVFDGEKKSPYGEEDIPQPINVYGISKLGGENFVSYFMEEYFIFRTSFLFGKYKDNFVTRCIKDLKSGKEITAACDQMISPTYVDDFAYALKEFLKKVRALPQKGEARYGIYHLVNQGGCSRYELAIEIAKILDFDTDLITGLNLAQIPKDADRPLFSVLSCEKFQKFTGITLRNWKEALREFISQFIKKR